eukprot:2306438-Amphidinium_carterae.1
MAFHTLQQVSARFGWPTLGYLAPCPVAHTAWQFTSCARGPLRSRMAAVPEGERRVLRARAHALQMYLRLNHQYRSSGLHFGLLQGASNLPWCCEAPIKAVPMVQVS